MPPTLLPKYKALDNNTRYTLVEGGRGSAKSFHLAVKKLYDSFTPNWVTLYTRYTMTSAEKSIIPEFEEKINLFGMQGVFDISKNQIYNKVSGGKILFSGIKSSSGNQTARLKSITGLNDWVLDEAEEMTNPKEFHTIDDSIRVLGLPNKVTLVLNPADVEHWIYKHFHESGRREDTTYIHTTYLDNPFLSKSFTDKAEWYKENDLDFYNLNYLGQWSALVDSIFPKGYETFEDEPEDCELYCLGGDFGFADHPTAVVRVWLHRNNVYLKEIVYDTGLTNEEIAYAIPENLRNEICIFDSSEKKSVLELRRHGVNAYPAKKGPNSVTYSIRKLQGLNVFIHKDSKNLQNEWTKYRWAKKGNGEYVRKGDGMHRVPVKLKDDAIDAVRYAIMYLTKFE